eukprot:3184539-Pleurochrysis_carterae.AAC.1
MTLAIAQLDDSSAWHIEKLIIAGMYEIDCNFQYEKILHEKGNLAHIFCGTCSSSLKFQPVGHLIIPYLVRHVGETTISNMGESLGISKHMVIEQRSKVVTGNGSSIAQLVMQRGEKRADFRTWTTCKYPDVSCLFEQILLSNLERTKGRDALLLLARGALMRPGPSACLQCICISHFG